MDSQVLLCGRWTCIAPIMVCMVEQTQKNKAVHGKGRTVLEERLGQDGSIGAGRKRNAGSQSLSALRGEVGIDSMPSVSFTVGCG